MLRKGTTPRSQQAGSLGITNILALLEKQNYKCALSGWALTPETASIDHIKPLSKGGTHVGENAQILHCDVNRAKNSMDNDSFIAMCRAVTNHAK